MNARIFLPPEDDKILWGNFHGSLSWSSIIALSIIGLNIRRDPKDIIKDPFFESSNGNLTPRGVGRIIQLAAMLFAIDNQPATENILNRFKRENIQSTFWELCCAGFMAQLGFTIYPGKSTGNKGQDFDFLICLENFRAACEVISLRILDLEGRKLSKKLWRKIDQLPNEQPSFLFCIMNDDHKMGKVDVYEAIKKAGVEILLESPKPTYINFIVRDNKASTSYHPIFVHNPRTIFHAPSIGLLQQKYDALTSWTELSEIESGRGQFFEYVKWRIDRAAGQAG